MEYTAQMKNRLKRIDGQIRGILNMMEQGEDCRSVVTQMTAARTAMDRALGLVIGKNLEACLREQIESGKGSTESIVNEAVQMLVKSR
ncbi:metal-sensitive transcriptional regulator [Sporolactobacillus sp. Y61]|jgi:DNA-binding FrmR family transcriptional regulator|uniref:Metal-sensitive transcriptional regulator n=1 Tax=Sporolactobacillus sp. Y61 TaxID=3160863 RepID=A0AAU8IFT6_9BACL|nr:metal-sensitive transcriptional regulator [Sporolactobacillus sp. THM19-2]RYL88457.1 metal-sensitive transcriptional regulator [Sporolactobacillus sp. THM19-2]